MTFPRSEIMTKAPREQAALPSTGLMYGLLVEQTSREGGGGKGGGGERSHGLLLLTGTLRVQLLEMLLPCGKIEDRTGSL